MTDFNWQNAAIFLLVVAVFVPWLWAELRAARKSRQIFRPDQVARRHRAIAKRGFKSRMQNHREFGA